MTWGSVLKVCVAMEQCSKGMCDMGQCSKGLCGNGAVF